MAVFFSRELQCGTKIVHGSAARAAAKAMDWPWLPRVAVTTPLKCRPLCLRASR